MACLFCILAGLIAILISRTLNASPTGIRAVQWLTQSIHRAGWVLVNLLFVAFAYGLVRLPGAIVTASVLIWLHLRAFLARRRREQIEAWRAKGRCIECGYDLRGSLDRCSECGRSVPWTVTVYNDDVHTFEHVIHLLTFDVKHTPNEAQRLTQEVHEQGHAQVMEGEKSAAEACGQRLRAGGLHVSVIGPGHQRPDHRLETSQPAGT